MGADGKAKPVEDSICLSIQWPVHQPHEAVNWPEQPVCGGPQTRGAYSLSIGMLICSQGGLSNSERLLRASHQISQRNYADSRTCLIILGKVEH